MLITCPSCDTRFSVADHLIGSTGRLLRCIKCAHQWRYIPQAINLAETHDLGDAGHLHDKKLANPLHTIKNAMEKGQTPIEAFTHAAPATDIIEELSGDSDENIERVQHRLIKKYVYLTLLGILSLSLILFIFIFWSVFADFSRTLKNTVTYWLGFEQESLSDPLEIANVKFTRQQKDGKNIIKIEGVIFNLSEQVMEVPPMAAIAINKEGKEVPPGRSFALLAGQIQPGEIISFQTIIVDISNEAEHLRIGFAK